MDYQNIPILEYKVICKDGNEKTIVFDSQQFDKADEVLNFKRENTPYEWELIAVVDA